MKDNTLFLLTGASGFLGSVICRQLVERGERVRAFVMPGDKAERYIPQGVEVVHGDLCNRNQLADFFRVEDGVRLKVIHCASIVTVDPSYNQKVMEVNVGGTRNIIDLCRESAVFEKLVYVGSTGTLPEAPHGTPICEPECFDSKLPRDCYSQSKAAASQLVLNAAHEGMNACIVMPTGIMGPGDFSISTTTHTVVEIIHGKMPIGIDGSFNLVDVRDLAAGTIAAMDKGRRGESYILGNDLLRFRDFARTIHHLTGCKPIRIFLSCKMANRIAAFLERRAGRTGKKPLMTTFSVYNLARNNVFDSSKARRELGYTTRPVEETLREEVLWLKENKII